MAYKIELSDQFLSNNEIPVFDDFLSSTGLDRSIWDVYACLFETGNKYTKPMMVRVFDGSGLCGAVIVVKCKKYGKSLFTNRLLSGIIDLVGIPFYLWVKFGACMDMMSNTGFVKNINDKAVIIEAVITFLKKNSLLTLINDYTDNNHLYTSNAPVVLPALPHALIDTTSMNDVTAYTKSFKNIRRKIKRFAKMGGIYTRVDNRLDAAQIASLKNCFLSTSEKSVFYLPYQDLYLRAAMHTSSKHIDGVYYFVATLNGEFLGYQAAIKTGRNLNALHGAFDRSRKTTFHAYDILFVKMTEFSIEHGLNMIDFGAVLNYTKQKMINTSIDMSYFVFSKYAVVRNIFGVLLKKTKIQSNSQLQFRNSINKSP